MTIKDLYKTLGNMISNYGDYEIAIYHEMTGDEIAFSFDDDHEQVDICNDLNC